MLFGRAGLRRWNAGGTLPRVVRVERKRRDCTYRRAALQANPGRRCRDRPDRQTPARPTRHNGGHDCPSPLPARPPAGRAQNALDTVAGKPRARRPNPADDTAEVELDDAERRHAAGLMRINHVGEVCAQGLYIGQAAVARDPQTRDAPAGGRAGGDRPPGLVRRPPARAGQPPQPVQPALVRRQLRDRRAGRPARRRLEPGLRGRNRAPGRGPPGRTPADPARSRPAQPGNPRR